MSLTETRRPPILDPSSIAVVGIDEHLPAIQAERLTSDFLRQRLAGAGPRLPAIAGDDVGGSMAVDQPPHRAAAVLVPLVERPVGLQVLLTRRTDHLRHHAGQISFPGGRVESGDADAEATALREAAEEVGLQARDIEVIGQMAAYTTVTRFIVTPVVGLVHPGHALLLDANEVATTFEVPLAFLMDPAHHRRHRIDTPAGPREFLSMPWPGATGEVYVWGATAAMLRNLYHLLAD